MARPRSDLARQKLLTAAAEILATTGVGSLTIEDVSRRSGVAKTTLYRHFGTLEALVFAVVALDVSAFEAPDTGTLRGDLAEIQRHDLAVAASHQWRELFAWMVTKAIEDPGCRELFQQTRVSPQGRTALALQRAKDRGELPAELDIFAAMHLIHGPLISQRIIDNSDVTDAELDAMLDMIVRGLGVTG